MLQLTMSLILKRVFVGGITVLLSSLLTTALLYESSPLYQDASKNSMWRMLLLIINLPSVTVGGATGNLPLTIFVFVAQWFLIGVFCAWLVERIRILRKK